MYMHIYLSNQNLLNPSCHTTAYMCSQFLRVVELLNYHHECKSAKTGLQSLGTDFWAVVEIIALLSKREFPASS